MTEQEFEQLLVPKHEQSGVEFKVSGLRSDGKFLTKIIRAAIGMSNRRDGGLIVIGVDEDKSGAPVVKGMSDEHLGTWQFDTFSDSLAEYADPNPRFEIENFEYHSMKLIAIRVFEFEDFPIICKKTYPENLRAGACYVRSRRKPETLDIPTHIDMRDLLELATEKGVRKFVSQAQRAGLSISNTSESSDASLFHSQLSDLLAGLYPI